MPRWLALAECVLLALAVAGSVDIAITQSKTQIQEWLASPDLMLDTAVVLTVDVAIQIAFCIVMAGRTRSIRERVIKSMLMAVPGLLVVPVVFACLVEMIFLFTGIGFGTVAYAFACGLLVVVTLAVCGMKWLLPADGQRLELIFYLNCIIAMLGIVATVNGRTAATGMDSTDITALGAVTALMATAAFTGYIIYKHKNKHLI
ncbi:MAG: hypothetical protein K2J00_08790 [Bacteroidaceae bacterium]|nr:hypothetical protein [Bacteroidaceae bacterium]